MARFHHGLTVALTAVFTLPSVCAVRTAFAEPLAFTTQLTAGERTLLLTTLGHAEDFKSDPSVKGDDLPVRMATVDLNGDGKPDYIVVLTSTYWGGSHGQHAAVHLSNGGGYIMALQVIAHDISLGKGRTNGVRDIVTNDRFRWIWNGKQYVVKK